MTHKYHAKPTTYDGHRFDSLAEARRYQELKLAEYAGHIADLTIHPTFTLQAPFRDNTGKAQRAIVYEADFSYVDRATGRRCVEDVKGMATQTWLIKKKLFLHNYPELELRITK